MFEALKVLSEGIVLNRSNNLILNEQTLEEIREPMFILLYRIMFVLYAEDRSVFPDEKFYHDNFSLKWIKIHWILKSSHNINEYQVYERLKKLFRLIEMGSEDLGYEPEEFFMRSYYGRLFDRKIHSRLEKWKIPNRNLLDAIGLLTRTRDKTGNYFFLDYAALETRHLGAIYEHLLEYHLTAKDGAVADLPNPKERKSTGSYYTPQYIVGYIVENAIGPLIDDIIKKTSDPSDQIDNILALNILDPAMGSGHFLVGATNYIAKRICQIEYTNEITEDVFVERKRDVARRCIYGVDINPLAVDLASVSLWLETLSSEKPLSFLSAHLKSGNSLIGSSIDDILEKQMTLMESTRGRARFKKTVKDFIMLENLGDDSAQAVKTKITMYDHMQSAGTVYHDLKFLLDGKLAKSFGASVPPTGDFVQKIGEDGLDFYKGNTWLGVKTISQKYSFFHWDLEFPSIFYSEDGKRKRNPGFDAVIGNPPYGAKLMKQEKEYLNKKLQVGVLNTASLFLKKGIELLCKNWYLGFIVPKSFLTVSSWKPIRRFILDHSLVRVNDVGKQWRMVGLEQTILITRNSPRQTVTDVLAKFNYVDKIPQKVFKDRDAILTWLDREKLSLIEKIEKDSTMLESISTMPRGITVKSLEYFSEPSSNLIQVLGGTNIKRFLIKNGSKRKPNRFLKRHDSRLISKKNIFNQKRIIFQNVASSVPRIVATIENNRLPTDDTVNNLTLTDDSYSYEDILAILNSDLATFYLRYAIINNSELTIHLDRPYVGKIPIRNPKGKLLKNATTILKNKQEINEKTIKLFNRIQECLPNISILQRLGSRHEINFVDFLKELEKCGGKQYLKEKNKLEYYLSAYLTQTTKLLEQTNQATDELNRIVYEMYGLLPHESKLINEELHKKSDLVLSDVDTP